MKYLKLFENFEQSKTREEEEGDEYFENYEFEDFTHANMEDVSDLLEDGLTIKQIAIELDMDIHVARQIVEAILKNQPVFSVTDELEGLDESKKF